MSGRRLQDLMGSCRRGRCRSRDCLARAIRYAEGNDLVGRNVAALVKSPTGRQGRPSKALAVEQAQTLIEAAAGRLRGEDVDAKSHRLHAYVVVVLLMTGIRPEEARAPRWDHVDLEAGTVAIWRSDRAGGDTKTVPVTPDAEAPELALNALRELAGSKTAPHQSADGEVPFSYSPAGYGGHWFPTASCALYAPKFVSRP